MMSKSNVLGMLAIGIVCLSVRAQAADPVDRYQISSTVSPEANIALQKIYASLRDRPAPQRPISDVQWDQRSAQVEAVFGPQSRHVADSLGVSTSTDTIADVPVLRIKPANFKPNGRILLYLHGGGYVQFSAASTLMIPALYATSSGDEVISIDYTLAPHGNWRTITDQVLAVWSGVLARGKKPASIALAGDSAGGGLALGSVLKMRDAGLPMPGALWVLSPWSDLSLVGESRTTLSAVEPVLNSTSETWYADAYVALADRNNPYVSPVYGDFKKAFPATLIQVGTREMLLSDAVRQYQAIRNGGQQATLDVYEGMPHVFQALIPQAPETRMAILRATAFIKASLDAH